MGSNNVSRKPKALGAIGSNLPEASILVISAIIAGIALSASGVIAGEPAGAPVRLAEGVSELAGSSASATEGIGYGLATIPFFMRDILWLRSLVILTGLLVIFYNFTGLVATNWILVLAMGVVVITNVVRILHLLWEKRRVLFNEEEQALFETVFHQFSPVEFMKLMRVGNWRSADPGTVLASEGEGLDELILIGRGEAAVERKGEEVARARDGAIIGEMSFLKGGGASATVRAIRPTRYLAWPRKDLRKLLRRNPTMDTAMRTVLTMELIHKLEEPHNIANGRIT